MMNDDRFLTVDEVAERLRANPQTIRRWLREGKLRGVRPGGDKLGWRIRSADLAALLGTQQLPLRPGRPAAAEQAAAGGRLLRDLRRNAERARDRGDLDEAASWEAAAAAHAAARSLP